VDHKEVEAGVLFHPWHFRSMQMEVG